MIIRSADICADSRFPMESYIGLLYYGEKGAIPYSLPQRNPIAGQWGVSTADKITVEEVSRPFSYLEVAWLSVVEAQFYYAVVAVGKHLEALAAAANGETFEKLLVGLAPYGRLAVWAVAEGRSTLLTWASARKIDIPLEEYLQYRPSFTLEQYCRSVVGRCSDAKEYAAAVGMPPTNLFDKYMQQFCYRYNIDFHTVDKSRQEALPDKQPRLDYIEANCYDGTYDRRKDDALLRHHLAGKPRRLSVAWHVGKHEHTAHFWLDEAAVGEVFERFYGVHRDTRSDLIVSIDAEGRKYGLALFRQGLREPVAIPEAAYQLIVFKNKFEDYRSPNYRQERGAWIW